MATSLDMLCWKCGTELKNVLLPFSRYEECTSCQADLHSCIGCKHYQPFIADACREDRADFVLEKEMANFCEYFTANRNAYQEIDDSAARQARARLADLFGEQSADDAVEQAIETPQSEAEKALSKLNQLFGDNK
jgi:hypothetical protein